MRENRPYGSEGGAGDIPPFLPLSVHSANSRQFFEVFPSHEPTGHW